LIAYQASVKAIDIVIEANEDIKDRQLFRGIGALSVTFVAKL